MIILGHGEFDQVDKFNDCFGRAIDATRQKFLTTIYEDFYDDPVSYGNSTRWNPAGANTNSFSFIAGDEAGGSLILSTRATANSLVGLTPANAIGGTPWTVATATPGKAFYLEAKFKITTTPDAATKAYVGFTDGTNTLLSGVFGPNSATAWAVQHSANEITTYSNFTGIAAVNTSYHTVKMWSTGQTGSVFTQMDFDGASPSNVNEVVPTVTYSKLRLWCRARNVGTAADQRLQLAYLFCATQP